MLYGFLQFTTLPYTTHFAHPTSADEYNTISTKGVARVQRGRSECGQATEAMFPHEQFNNSSYCCGAALIRAIAAFILFYITS